MLQELLVYKCIPLDSSLESSNNVDFQLIWRRSFANPLFAIEYLDLTNDGLKEITVASLSGLHVLQVSDHFRGQLTAGETVFLLISLRAFNLQVCGSNLGSAV